MEILYKKKLFPYITIILLTIISTFVLWLPFFSNIKEVWGIKLPQQGLKTIVANWDGPLYIIPAKTLYNPNNEIFNDPPLGLSSKYYPAHLPMYPLTIRFLSQFVSYPNAMLLSTILASIGLFATFYFFIKKYKLSSHPLLLTVMLSFWPRLLIARSVGSPEPLFLLLILASIFLFIEKKYLVSSILGGLAVATKTPGVLLFLVYFVFLIYGYFSNRKFLLSSASILLIPLSLIGVFYLYSIQLGDFFAYYHTEAVVPMTRLFSQFNSSAKWVGTAWLEDILFLFSLLTTATINSITKKGDQNRLVYKIVGILMGIFLMSLFFVEHRDISRYSLPLIPFAFIIFEKNITDRRFVVSCLIILPAIYLYSINFIIANASPITNWLPFL